MSRGHKHWGQASLCDRGRVVPLFWASLLTWTGDSSLTGLWRGSLGQAPHTAVPGETVGGPWLRSSIPAEGGRRGVARDFLPTSTPTPTGATGLEDSSLLGFCESSVFTSDYLTWWRLWGERLRRFSSPQGRASPSPWTPLITLGESRPLHPGSRSAGSFPRTGCSVGCAAGVRWALGAWSPARPGRAAAVLTCSSHLGRGPGR